MAVIPVALLSVDGTSSAGSRATRGCAGPSRTRARESASPLARGPASTHALYALCASSTPRPGAPSARQGVVVARMVRFPESQIRSSDRAGVALTVLPDPAIRPVGGNARRASYRGQR